MNIQLPPWLDGTVAGVLVMMFLVLFVVPIAKTFGKKQNAEGTLAMETIAQLKERNEALSEERMQNAAAERQLRAAHSQELRDLREAHNAERKAAGDTATALQKRVLDLTERLVLQAQEHSARVTDAVERVREELRADIAELRTKLELSEALNQECEKRHIERDAEDRLRRDADERRNAERDQKIDALLALVNEAKLLPNS